MRYLFSFFLILVLGALAVGWSRVDRQGPGIVGQAWSMEDPTRDFVESLRKDMGEQVREKVETNATRKTFERIVKDHVKIPWATRRKKGIRYADLFQEVYTRHEWKKFAVTHKGLNARSKAMLDVLRASDKHTFRPKTYHLQKIEELDTQIQQLQKDVVAWDPVVLSGEEVEVLVQWVRAQNKPLDETLQRQIITAFSSTKPPKQGPTPPKRISQQVTTYHNAVSKTAEPAAQLELYLFDGVLRHARDIKLFSLTGISWKEIKKAGGAKKFIYRRLDVLFTKLHDSTPEKATQILEELAPRHPQYALLVNLRKRILDGIEQKRDKPVTPFALTKGSRHKRAVQLKQRLYDEGFLQQKETLTSSVVDKPLLNAVGAYKRAHRVASSSRFWQELNRGLKRKKKLVELSMKRWRSSAYKGEKEYIWVNLPDFHAEVFQKGKQQLRFRVVIGKANKVCDPKTAKWIYPNATPTLASNLEYFILNPTWYVPDRIIQEEILPRMEKDETWLEKNGYELVKKRRNKGKIVIRQRPGPKNALGQAKFIFPNRHNTYMHDTSRKKHFDYEYRAHSHGCIRVSEPLKLARHLVDADGQSKDVDVDAILKSPHSKMVKMKSQVPVYVEYHTLWMHPGGWPRFLRDVYRKDPLALREVSRASLRCTPPPTEEEAKKSDDVGP